MTTQVRNQNIYIYTRRDRLSYYNTRFTPVTEANIDT